MYKALLVLFAVTVCSPVNADVLCRDSKGAIFVRMQCEKGKTQLDPAALGLQGQPGPQGLAGPQGIQGPQGNAGPPGPEATTFWPTFWSALSAIATALAVCGVGFAVRQLQFDAWLKAQEVFTEKSFTEARRKVFAHLQNPSEPKGLQSWSGHEIENGKEVCRKMDELARLVPYFSWPGFSYRAREKALKVWDDPIAKSWSILEPILIEERRVTLVA